MEENDPRFSHVDLGSLLEDLYNFAKGLFRQKKCSAEDAILPGTGKSPEDLVNNALTVFIIKKPNWRPSSPETAQAQMFFLVRKMVKNKFIDLVRSPAYKGAIKGQAGEDSALADDFPDGDDESGVLLEELNDEEIIRRAYAAVEGEPDLEEYLDAVLRDGYTKRSKVAAHLEIDLRDATRRRDKLKTRLLPLKRALEAGR